MKVAREISELGAHLRGTVGLVPTMGAFHEGHLSLMRAARKECETVVVSLFVNPTQFGPNEDYTRYPRDEDADFAMAEAEKVDVVFAPSAEGMYPRKATEIRVTGVTNRWEGERRPGHFDGVALVVCKLFNIVRPSAAYFGLKDYQQCAVIRTMVEDLNLPVRLRLCDIVREPSGLAMSSRNRYLTDEERSRAPLLYRELTRVSDELRSSDPCDEDAVAKSLKTGVHNLTQSGFLVDYFALVDPRTLEPLADLQEEARLIVAAKLGSVRLIDNVSV